MLAALWRADKAMVPAEVRAAMGQDLAYTTVPPILTRLWEKGLLHRTLRGRACEYSASDSKRVAQWQRPALRSRLPWRAPR